MFLFPRQRKEEKLESVQRLDSSMLAIDILRLKKCHLRFSWCNLIPRPIMLNDTRYREMEVKYVEYSYIDGR